MVRLPVPLVVVVVRSVVPERMASERVDDEEQDKDDDVDDSNSLPVGLDVLEHTCLARVAVVAQHAHVVVPQQAISIGCRTGVCPAGGGDIQESTFIRRLAATRLT